MKKIFFMCILSMYVCFLSAQVATVKVNSLYWAFAAPNLGVELALNKKITVNMSGMYRPWTILKKNDMRFWNAEAQLRYWFCEKFEGHFLGLHTYGGQYNGDLKKYIYDGYMTGGGISYGYDWILSPHWNFELSGGFGYARLWYKKSPDLSCVKCQSIEKKNYWGITGISIAFSYIF